MLSTGCILLFHRTPFPQNENKWVLREMSGRPSQGLTQGLWRDGKSTTWEPSTPGDRSDPGNDTRSRKFKRVISSHFVGNVSRRIRYVWSGKTDFKTSLSVPEVKVSSQTISDLVARNLLWVPEWRTDGTMRRRDRSRLRRRRHYLPPEVRDVVSVGKTPLFRKLLLHVVICR